MRTIGLTIKEFCLSLMFIPFIISPVWSNQEEAPLVPSPSVFDFTRGQGWGVALGVTVEYESAYDGSDEYEFELDPAGAVHWRSGNHLIFWEGYEFGSRSRLADLWLVQVGVRYESGLEPDDSEDGYLDGIAERDSHIVGFLEARYALNSDWKNWVGVRAMCGESDFGLLGVIAVGHRFGTKIDATGTEAFLFSTFGDSAFINKDFGVPVSDSITSGLPETTHAWTSVATRVMIFRCQTIYGIKSTKPLGNSIGRTVS